MKKADKTDRRALRTKKALKQALYELMLEKDLRSISIRELTDRADIHRATFYAHYQDIYDLYEQIENEIFEQIDEKLLFNPSHDYASFFRTFINYVEEYSDSFRIMFNNASDNSFKEKLIQKLYDRTVDVTIEDEEMTLEELPLRWKYLLHYGTVGFISNLELWINSGFDFPKEDFINFTNEVDLHIDKLFE